MTAQQLLTAFETRAVPTAEPTRGPADLIVTATQTGRTVSIVSNNSGAAIAAYLADHRLTGYIRGIVASDDHDPDRMKPDPYRVRAAVGILDADNTECAHIGDTTARLLRRIPGDRLRQQTGQSSAALRDPGAAVTCDLGAITAALRAD